MLYQSKQGTSFAQENATESLHLPEVVITGTDQSKIQREIPMIPASQTSVLLIDLSSRDASEKQLLEGKLLAFVRPERAEELYLQAIALDPQNSEAYLRLANVYRAQGKDTAAAGSYLKALELSENTLDAHYQLGILYENRLQEACCPDCSAPAAGIF
jgi:tetratricopeptide (TPR) repeat protein